MKEIPMLFSTPMVQALLEGRKTQTRRIMKPQIKECDHSRFTEEWKDQPTQWSEAALKIGRAYCGMCGNGVEYSKDYGGIKCQYGVPGDLLYVRETFKVEQAVSHGESILGVRYKAGSMWIQNDSKEIFEIYHRGSEIWRPSIHMPKEAARLWLQVTDIKVERLQDISEEDAKAEGVTVTPGQVASNEIHRHVLKDRIPAGDHQLAFANLWREIHFTSIQDQLSGKDGWNENPWVWVVSFKVLSTTGKPSLLTENVNNEH